LPNRQGSPPPKRRGRRTAAFALRPAQPAAPVRIEAVARAADAAVVGSSLVQCLALNLNPDSTAKPGLVDAILAEVRALAQGVRNARKTL